MNCYYFYAIDLAVDDERLIEDVRRVKQEIQRLMKIGYYRTLMNY